MMNDHALPRVPQELFLVCRELFLPAYDLMIAVKDSILVPQAKKRPGQERRGVPRVGDQGHHPCNKKTVSI